MKRSEAENKLAEFLDDYFGGKDNRGRKQTVKNLLSLIEDELHMSLPNGYDWDPEDV